MPYIKKKNEDQWEISIRIVSSKLASMLKMLDESKASVRGMHLVPQAKSLSEPAKKYGPYPTKKPVKKPAKKLVWPAPKAKGHRKYNPKTQGTAAELVERSFTKNSDLSLGQIRDCIVSGGFAASSARYVLQRMIDKGKAVKVSRGVCQLIGEANG